MARWRLDKLKRLILEKSLRDDRRITNNDIAEATGLHWVTISRYVNGQVRRPDLETLQKIAQYFGVNVAYFLEEDSGESTETAMQNRRQPEVEFTG